MIDNDWYTEVGFWITVGGTTLSLISLIVTLVVSNRTKKIRDKLLDDHLKNKLKKTKKSIIKNFQVASTLIEKDEVFDEYLIEENIISIMNYQKVLSNPTKKKIKNLGKEINREKKNAKKIRLLIHEIILKIDNEVDEFEEYVGRITK